MSRTEHPSHIAFAIDRIDDGGNNGSPQLTKAELSSCAPTLALRTISIAKRAGRIGRGEYTRPCNVSVRDSD